MTARIPGTQLSAFELESRANIAREDRRELINMLHGFGLTWPRRRGNMYQRISTRQADHMRALLEAIISQSQDICYHTDTTGEDDGSRECTYCGYTWRDTQTCFICGNSGNTPTFLTSHTCQEKP